MLRETIDQLTETAEDGGVEASDVARAWLEYGTRHPDQLAEVTEEERRRLAKNGNGNAPHDE